MESDQRRYEKDMLENIGETKQKYYMKEFGAELLKMPYDTVLSHCQFEEG